MNRQAAVNPNFPRFSGRHRRRTDVTPSDDRYELFLQHFCVHSERLMIYIQSLLPHRADAEDVFQRTSLLLWQKFDSYQPDRPFLPWAFGVAFYEVKNFLRSASRDRLQFNDEMMDLIAARRVERGSRGDRRGEALRRCLQRLASKDRELLAAAYGDDSLIEHAAATGRAVQTLYNRLTRLRRQLMQCIESQTSPADTIRGVAK